jgi:hypothetical protein
MAVDDSIINLKDIKQYDNTEFRNEILFDLNSLREQRELSRERMMNDISQRLQWIREHCKVYMPLPSKNPKRPTDIILLSGRQTYIVPSCLLLGSARGLDYALQFKPDGSPVRYFCFPEKFRIIDLYLMGDYLFTLKQPDNAKPF